MFITGPNRRCFWPMPRELCMSDVIALIFDFDDTLAPDSTTGFLAEMGVDVEHFWNEQVGPLLFQQDWDPVPAYLYQMLELSNSGSYGAITPAPRQQIDRTNVM